MALQPLSLFNIRGRWGVNAPFGCPEDQCIEAVNIEFWRSTFARKRAGSTALSMAGGTAFTGAIKWIFSFVPGDNQTSRQLWGLDSAITPLFKTLTGGTAWANVTNSSGDAVTLASNHFTNGCTFNGKLMLAYDSAVNRLHLFDPAVGAIQRVGIARVAAAPTVADTGGGAYAAVARYYRVVFAEILSGVIINCRSNPTDISTVFTPSGAGAAARVTRPALPGEKETHWLLYASATAADFRLIATTAIATTTFDDNTLPANYSGNLLPDSAAFNCPPSAKYLVADKTRLIMAGAWETVTGTGMAPSPRRIWWTSPLGATDEGDDQRVSNTASIKSYTDIDDAVTGMSSPQEGTIYVWSYRQMYKMTDTGVPDAPYVTYKVTGARGCVEHKSIVTAEDENCNPCTYWWSPQGPCRMGDSGIFSMVEDITDKWDLINLSATMVCHGVYHQDKHQIWWWVAVSGSLYPNLRMTFDTRLGRMSDPGVLRKGWATHSGSVDAWSSTMHSNTVAALNSLDLKPYSSMASFQGVLKLDTGSQDWNGSGAVNYESYVLTRPYLPAGLGSLSGITESACMVAEASGGTVSIDAVIDFGSRDVDMGFKVLNGVVGPVGTSTRVFPRFDNSLVSMANSIQFRVGDNLPLELDVVVIPIWNIDAAAIPNTMMGRI